MSINKIVLRSYLGLFFILCTSISFCATSTDYCPVPGALQYQPSGTCETKNRTCCNNSYFSNWGEACPVEKWTYTTEHLPTIVSACSGYGICPATICNGSVAWRTKYTAHQLTNCDNRAQGNGHNWTGSTSKTQGDGSVCSDTNYYGVNGGSGSDKRPEEAYCNGWTQSLPDCSYNIEETCKNRGYEGYLCVDYWYSSGSTQIFSLPCHQNGIYCYYLGGGSYDSIRLASTGSARVIKCVKE